MVRSLRVKWLLAFGASVVLTVAVGIFAIAQIDTLSARAAFLGSDSLPSVTLVNQINVTMASYRIATYRHIANPAREQKDFYLARITDYQRQMDDLLQQYARYVNTESERAAFERIRSSWASYVADTDGVLRISDTGDQARALEAQQRSVRLYDEDLVAQAAELVQQADRLAEAATAAAAQTAATARAVMLTMTVIASTISAALGLLLATSLTRTITRLTSATSDVASGNLDRRVTLRSHDELGTLATAFNQMVDSLQASRLAEEQALEQQRIIAADLRRTVESLRETTGELKEANSELEAFSYSVSHDLRAPLRAIDGFSRLLEEDAGPQLDSDAQRYLALIRQNAKRMGLLIDNLLSFSRTGRQELHRRRIAPNELIQTVLEDLAPQLEGRRVAFVIGNLPVCEADPSLLRQVWENLISNAIKYTRTRALARIEIGAQAQNGVVIYAVHDNGAGFDMRYGEKLFGVFQRLHAPQEYEGTGIGLALVQRIIQRHGGRIWAEAEVDRGASFYFTLGEATSDA